MLVDELYRRQKKLKSIISFCRNWLKSAPEGTLIVSRRKGVNYYYKRNGRKRIYISARTGLNTIKVLAVKNYYQKVIEKAETEMKLINKLIRQKQNNPITSAYDKLHPAKKAFIEPFELTVEQQKEKWLSKEYPPFEDQDGNFRVATKRGDYVRSRGERLIANMLYDNKIPYKYEIIHQASNGERLRPDFQVMNPRTGELFIWEHFGMMDNPNYVNKSMMKKLGIYAIDGIYPGNSLITTFEDKTYILEESLVKRIIKEKLS